ncbi:TspO protein [Parcubacteria bacterium DG_74_2]|nr:MAG: TspO protein [Parcubacteria bacterium DG_74_2]
MKINITKFVVSILVCQLAGFIGSFFTAPAIPTPWFAELKKPSFFPPNWLFAPAWTVLYLLMGISLFLVWKKNWGIIITAGEQEKKAWNPFSTKLWRGSWREENAVLIFSLQLVLNVLWSVIFFGLKSPGIAFFEILMLWFAILYTIVNFYRISKPAAYLLIPYILWVSFATLLNFSTWQLNL